MTIILLSIIAVLMFARIALQVRQGKRAVEKGYCTASEVENTCYNTLNSLTYIDKALEEMSQKGWELVAVNKSRDNSEMVYLFFTRKKIKTYYE